MARALPLAQDHKRIGEGDTGPNTGGMGAYAPAPVPYDADELVATFVQPVLDHFAAAGTPYVGVLYAGLMLTADGPRLVEYNVRFGDPEAQAVLPLLDSDLAALALAATRGELAVGRRCAIRPGAACTVVAAAPGYPAAPILGGEVLTTLVPLSATSVDRTVCAAVPGGDGRRSGHRRAGARGHRARRRPRRGAGRGVRGDGRRAVRRDAGAARHRLAGAGRRRCARTPTPASTSTRAPAPSPAMKAAVERTHGAEVVRGVGSFGGVFSAKAIAAMDDPVLVASTDGVGTKVELAARLGRVRGVGADIVNHCIDDVLVQGARPLFFLDYIASSRLDADVVADVVTGMAEACEAAGCALLGGETAEMPGVYAPGAFDIAGTLVGVAERADAAPPRRRRAPATS